MSFAFFDLTSCSDKTVTQKVEAVPAHPRTIRIDLKLRGSDGSALQLVLYKASHINLLEVPVETVKLAVVNPQEVLERTNSGKRTLAALRTWADNEKASLGRMEENLKRQESKLRNANPGSSEESDLESSFRKDLDVFRREANRFNTELKKRQESLVDTYMQRISLVVETVAKKRGFELVIDNFERFDAGKSLLSPPVSTLLQRDNPDITSSVIDEFNTVYP